MTGEKIKLAALEELPNLIDQDRLRCWFLAVFHQSKIICCHCGQPVSQRSRKSYLEYRITSCANCGKKIQLFRGTIFQNAKISRKQFVLIAAYLELGVPTTNIAKVLNLSPSTVWQWAKKINQYGEERC